MRLAGYGLEKPHKTIRLFTCRLHLSFLTSAGMKLETKGTAVCLNGQMVESLDYATAPENVERQHVVKLEQDGWVRVDKEVFTEVLQAFREVVAKQLQSSSGNANPC